jgi:hypothetical protein
MLLLPLDMRMGVDSDSRKQEAEPRVVDQDHYEYELSSDDEGQEVFSRAARSTDQHRRIFRSARSLKQITINNK